MIETLQPSARLEVREVRMGVGNTNAFCLQAGDGPPVVLLHGGASDCRDWAGTMSALANKYHLYAPDLVGYGRSSKNGAGYYMSDFTEFLIGFIRALELTSPALVGHSVGGRVCLEVALRHSEMVSKLVLVDSVGFGRLARWGAFLGTAAWALRTLRGRSQPYPRFLKRKGEDPEWRCLDELPHLKPPTLIVWNRRDPYFSVNGAIEASRLIPDCRLEIFPAFGHAPHVKMRQKFNDLLRNFLEQG